MRYFRYKLSEHLKALNQAQSPDQPWTLNLVSRRADIPSSNITGWNKPKGDKYYRAPSDSELEKLVGVKELGLDLDRIKGWRAIDVEGPSAILQAISDAKEAQSLY